ncbi:cellobiose phosphorylase [Microbulbifer hydrolyticus]|uniref:Cellobiose phosphorylase n=1 Tax=Microbulbifer hydrolyticus TaxID=48074 RepID=A0A6P1TBK3_9GAMM|nr:glucoamylase family protein [Microbulbifer hydrolyticus]MBB5210400.1 cyclic beta-1,2-glucan synthetase [Microbulbifer hydrolyticus]QHQ39115.1 cellobiose phosphorylase [Microbulbifer hydrolyticus]
MTPSGSNQAQNPDEEDARNRTEEMAVLAKRHRHVLEEHHDVRLSTFLRHLDKDFRAIYRDLAIRVEAGKKGTRSEEWLLDNRHVVQEALELVRESLPRKYLKQLPKVSDEDGSTSLRVWSLSAMLVSGLRQPLDLESVHDLIDHYQQETILTTGELWALPAVLRLSLLQKLAGSSEEVLKRIARGEDAESVGIASAIISLRELRTFDWRNFVESLSRVERILETDPAAAYMRMDFATRDRYRGVIEQLSRGSDSAEHRVAQCVVELSDRETEDSRQRHIGYYLIGDGRPELEEAVAFTPDTRQRLHQMLLDRPSSVYFTTLAFFSVPALLVLATYLLLSGTGIATTLLVCAVATVPIVGIALALVNGLITHSLSPSKLPKMDFSRGIPEEYRSAVVMPVLVADIDDIERIFQCLEMNFLNNDDRNLVYVILSDFSDAGAQTTSGDEALLQALRESVEALNHRYNDSEGRSPFLLLHRERHWNSAETCWMGWERKRGKLLEFNRLLRGHDDHSFTTCFGNRDLLQKIHFVITLDADSQMPPATAARLVATMAHPLNRLVIDSEGRRVIDGHGFLQPRLEIDPSGTEETTFSEIFSGDRTVDLYTHAVSDAYQDLFGEGIFAGKGIYDPKVFSQTLAGRLPENAILSHDLLEGAVGGAALISDAVFYEQYPPNIFTLLRRSHRWIRGDWQLLPWLRRRVRVEGGEKLPNPLPVIQRWKIIDNLRRSLEAPALLALFVFAWFGLLGGSAWSWTLGLLLLSAAPVWLELLSLLWQCVSCPTRAHLRLRSGPAILHQRTLFWLMSLAVLPVVSINALDAIVRTLYRMAISRRHLLQWTAAAQVNRSFSATSVTGRCWRELWVSPVLALLITAGLILAQPTSLLPAAPFLIAWLFLPRLIRRINQPHRVETQELGDDDKRDLRLLARRTWYFFEHFMGPDDHWLPPDNYQEEPVAVLARRTSPTNIGLGLLSILSAYDFGYLDLAQLLARLNNTFDRMRGLERYRGHFLNWYETRELHPLNPRYVSTVDSGNLAGSLLTLASGLENLDSIPLSGRQLVMGIADTLGVVVETLQPANPDTVSPEVREITKQITELRKRLEVRAEQEYWWQTIDDIYERDVPALHEQVLTLIERDESFSAESLGRLRHWLDELHQHSVAARRYQENLEPWQRLMQAPPVACREQGSQAAESFRELAEILDAPVTLKTLAYTSERAASQLNTLSQVLATVSNEQQQSAQAWTDKLRTALVVAQDNAGTYREDIHRLAERARDWVREMDFAFLYDNQRHLFHIGYNVTDARLDANYYDLLASESRLTGFIAVAKGDVPARHWRHLERPFRRIRRRVVLMSWSATLFEYLMPRLLMETPDHSLMGQACRSAIEVHQDFAKRFGVPWGIAESGFYELDSQMHYQYRAFGVPGIGFRRDLGERLVIAPYASMMALPFCADRVMENLRRLRSHGGYGQFGLHEAIDFGRTAKPAPRRARTVRSYMSHHQGMILMAINNFLHSDVMLQRFHSDVRIAGLTPLLHERLPAAPPALKPWKLPGVMRSFETEVVLDTWNATPSHPYPQYNLLSNGHYSLILAADGGGGSYWDNIALTRWQPDPTHHQWGRFCYVRDLDSDLLFSVGLSPCGGEASRRTANFSPQSVEFQCRESELFCRLHIAVSSQHDIEARRLVIKNESDRERRLLLSDFAEVVLAPERDDLRHPAFAKLFVESQYLPEEQVMIYRRRPRGSNEKPIYMAECVLVQPGVRHRLGWETDRTRFLGRGGTPVRPRAMAAGLAGFSGTTGPVLDPVIAAAQEVTIPPQSEIEVVYLTGVSKSRQELLTSLRGYRSRPKARWVFDLARMQSEQELHNLHIAAGAMRWMMDLLSFVLAPIGSLRAPSRVLANSRHIQPGLWSRGISGDNPILLVHICSDHEIDFAQAILQAHTYWCGRGVAVDLVIIDEESAGYEQQTRDRLNEMITDIRGRTLRKLSGSVVMVPGQELPGDERARLLAAARVILNSSAGSVAQQLKNGIATLRSQLEPLPPFVPVPHGDNTTQSTPELERPDDLLFDNGLGGFSADGREYVLHLEPGQRPPAPWVNVIANPNFGCLVSEGGSCCTWSGNSGEHRLTAWNNDPVRDPSGEVLYLRDEETAEVWTPTPAPRPADAVYQVRHGAGYSEFRHNSHGLEQFWRFYTDREEPVKFGRLTLTNCWDRPRRLTATYYVEWVQGLVRAASWPYLVSEFDTDTCALLARNAFVPDAKPGVAFLTASLPPHGLTTDRHEFLGNALSLEDPEALFRIGLSGRVQCGGDPCAAYQVHIDLAAGETKQVYFVMGEGEDTEQALALAREFRQPERAESARVGFEDFWEEYLGRVQVEVPDKATELMVNRWLPYQTLACRLWGRSGFYQSSGAFGFRDQLQDVQALLWTHPDWTREHILRAASRQFQDGDVLHWWHENPSRGVRTRCSDDLLWLPFVTAQYIRTTGDYEILHEPVSYLCGAPLQKDEHERYAEFDTSEESGSLYEHCCRAIERASAVGPHGLPVIGNGDWNDGFSRISTTGRGESVWMGWFLLRVCRDMSPLCEYIGDAGLADYYRALGENFRKQVEESGWDGAWYRRAYYDDGTPVGSSESDECKIDLIAQAWSVLSQKAPTDRARQAMESAYEHLVQEDARQILLLKPAFDKTKKDPGYIKGYPPGIRENGGQYTHAATWSVWAAAGLQHCDRGHHLFSLINPITHTDTPEGVQRYRTEPYVLAGDVYGVPPHVGRGGWTWYSGASGWLYRGALEALLGVRILDGNSLEIQPCLPQSWDYFRLSLAFKGSRYDIEVRNCGGCPREIAELLVDGKPVDGARISLNGDGGHHKVMWIFNKLETS